MRVSQVKVADNHQPPESLGKLPFTAWPRLEPFAVLVTNQFVRPKSKLTGAPGREIWCFKAVQPGTTTIQREYLRSWEKGIPPAWKTNVVALVEPPGAVK